MSTVHETLKVNDELSVEFDVIYENGEKYVQENTIWTSADGERHSWYETTYLDSIGGGLKIPTEPGEDDNEPRQTKAVELYKMEYMNALSYQINHEYYLDGLYKYAHCIVQLWNLWYEVDVEKLVSRWKRRYNNHKMEFYESLLMNFIGSLFSTVVNASLPMMKTCYSHLNSRWMTNMSSLTSTFSSSSYTLSSLSIKPTSCVSLNTSQFVLKHQMNCSFII